MSETLSFRRGDVILVPFPFITDFSQSKPRPALVVQNDVGNRYSPNLIVAAISSKVPDKGYPINHRLSSRNGQTGSGLGGADQRHPDHPSPAS